MNGNGKSANKTAKSPKNGAEIPLGAHPGNTGGKPGRSGRRPSAIGELARTLLDKHRLMEVVAGIARGDIEEEWFDHDGETHSAPTKNSDRISAVRLLLEYGYGKQIQVEHTGTIALEQIGVAREAFEGRMARLTARLGAAAMPEFDVPGREGGGGV